MTILFNTDESGDRYLVLCRLTESIVYAERVHDHRMVVAVGDGEWQDPPEAFQAALALDFSRQLES